MPSETRKAYNGLSASQRSIIAWWWETLGHNRGHHNGNARMDDSPKDGWSVYRMPTTVNPPTTVRLHYRDRYGKLQQVISITENGVDKVPF